MRKIFLSILTLLSVFPAEAATVTPDRARGIAAGVLHATRTGAVTLVWDGTDGTRGSEPDFYVFNSDGGGFAVIAADDRAYPVLGYSEEGSFKVDGMPSHIRAWFDNYGRQIESLRTSGAGQDRKMAALWKEVSAPSPVKVLKTALWGQDEPFNKKCPDKSLTGCVATSTATIMYYYKWPEKTSGEKLPSYTYFSDDNKKEISQPGHNLSLSYDWNRMLLSYNESYSQTAADAVGNLMYDIGIALQLQYGSEGTSGYAEDIIPVLVKYFDYDSCASLIYRDEMSSRQWSSLIKAEIDAGRPVSYSALDATNGGHQFILDGYGTEDTFHFNFGWCGGCDGLYRIDALNPAEYHLNLGQTAIIGLKPDAGGKGQDREKRIKYFILSTEDHYGGLSVTSGNIARGSSVTLAVNNICNLNGGDIPDTDLEPVHAQYAMCLLSRDNKIKETYGKTPFFNLNSGYLFSDTVKCSITCPLELGDKLMYCFRTGNNNEWMPVEIDYSYYNHLDEETSKIYNMSDAVAVFDFPAIKTDPDGYKADELIDLRLENCRYIPTVVWSVDGKELDNGINSVRLPAGKHTIKAVVKFYKSNTVTGSVIRTETLYRVIYVK